jgi:methionyl-tRNA formyltransferase
VTFRETASAIYNRFRAFDPWPGIFYKDVKLTACHPERREGPTAAGTILEISDDGVVVACAEGALRILEMQRPGKPRTPAAPVARGLGWKAGDVL